MSRFHHDSHYLHTWWDGPLAEKGKTDPQALKSTITAALTVITATDTIDIASDTNGIASDTNGIAADANDIAADAKFTALDTNAPKDLSILKMDISRTETGTLLLILLLSYAAFSKLAVLEKSRSEMMNQVFPIWIAEILYWLIPSIELGICTMLIFMKTRLAGLYASLLLMSAFSIYIGIIMTGIFGRIPCSCVGFYLI